jgi:membrane associated rhomboid family serine protease
MSYGRRPGFHVNPIYILIGVNVVILIATLINGDLIFSRFGLIPALVGQEPWTLFTYMFVHAGLWHLIGNMITLYFFGIYVIALIGETNFLITYFVGGIVGGLLFFVLSPLLGTTTDIVVGASGAVYALGGVLVAMVPKVKVYTLPIPIPLPLWVVIVFGFLITMMLSLEVNLAVAWQAHLGGLIYGLAIGYYFRTRRQRRY